MTPLLFLRAIALGGADGAGKVNLTLHELAVLTVLGLRANARGECFSTRARLASDARISEGACHAAVRGLVAKRLIEKSDRRRPDGRQDAPLFRLLLDRTSCHPVTPGDESSCHPVTPASRHATRGPAVMRARFQPSPGDTEEDQKKKIREEGGARASEDEIRKLPPSEWTERRGELLDAYVRTVREASGDPTWTMPTFGERDLRAVVTNRCVNEDRRDPAGWLEKHLQPFVAFAKTRDYRCDGFSPRGFAEWFNRGRPSPTTPTGDRSSRPRTPPPPMLKPPTVAKEDRVPPEFFTICRTQGLEAARAFLEDRKRSTAEEVKEAPEPSQARVPGR